MFNIRLATIEDIDLIRSLCLQVWPQTYAPLLTKEQIDYMLELMYSPATLKDQIDKGIEFSIIYDQEEAVGYTAVEELGPSIFKLQKIYILPSRQGKGTGRKTIEAIIAKVKAKGGKYLRLQVFKRNPARLFYGKMGFEIIEEIELDIGKGYIMDDYIMQKNL